MTIEDYNKQRQEIIDGLSSGTMSHEEASKKLLTLIQQHPQGLGLQDYAIISRQFPGLQAASQALEAQRQAGTLQGKVSTGLQVLADAGMLAASVGQIAAGNQAAQRLQAPSLPSVPGYNPQLTQALYEAQRGVMNPNAVLQPAQQQIQQGYLGAQQANQIASGGQAGALQSMNQVANLQRMQAALGLAPLAQDVKQQNFQNYSQLAPLRAAETQNMFQNRAAVSDSAFDRYRFGAQAAGLVGSSGRQNLMDATQRLAYHLGNYPVAPGQAPSWAQNAGFDPETNARMRNIYAETAMRRDPLYSQGYGQGGYGQRGFGYTGVQPPWVNQRIFNRGLAPRVNQNIYRQ